MSAQRRGPARVAPVDFHKGLNGHDLVNARALHLQAEQQQHTLPGAVTTSSMACLELPVLSQFRTRGNLILECVSRGIVVRPSCHDRGVPAGKSCSYRVTRTAVIDIAAVYIGLAPMKEGQHSFELKPFLLATNILDKIAFYL